MSERRQVPLEIRHSEEPKLAGRPERLNGEGRNAKRVTGPPRSQSAI
jgi:hypothetical protein